MSDDLDLVGRLRKAELQHDGLSRPLENPRLRVLSLGAGVQSTALALMAARGEIEAPDCAIFADTQSEPPAVYRHLDWLETQLPFPVHRVSVGNLGQEILDASTGVRPNHNRPPLFVWNAATASRGMTKRQCTRDFKIKPIKAEVRRLLGLRKGQQMRHFLGLARGVPVPEIVEQWVGISMDEIERLKVSDEPYIRLRHPLIEARMSRRDCVRWFGERQYQIPPKSACIFCTYHDNAMWRAIRDDDPASWAYACKIDEAIRAPGRHKGMRELGFIHSSLRPLAEANIDAPSDPRLNFLNECEGMCGV